jgi:CDP-diacylglycerol--glycerol-3-phosphate 3-phosphatidyltransferase
VIKSKFGDRVDGTVHVVFPFLFRRRLNPNLLTVVGTLVSLLAAVAFAAGEFVLAGVLILAGGFFDLVDGVVARHHGISTRFGAFLDSTLDRLVDMALLVGLAVHYATVGQPGNVLLAGVALVAGVMVSYSKARAELFVPKFDVGFFERAERVVVIAAGAVFGFMEIALWIVAIGSTATVIQRFTRAYREMERIDAMERERVGEHS